MSVTRSSNAPAPMLVDVTRAGVRGDGDGLGGGTDNATRLNALLDAGESLWFPRGIYNVGDDLVVPAATPVNLWGESTRYTKLWDTRDEGSTLAFRGTSAAGGNDHAHHSSVRFLTIDGALPGANTRIGFEATHASHLWLSYVEIFGAQRGMVGSGWWDSTIFGCRLQECGSRDGAGLAALELLSSSTFGFDTNNLHFPKLWVESCWDGDINVAGEGGNKPSQIEFPGLKSESVFCTGPRIRCSLVNNVKFHDYLALATSLGAGAAGPVNVFEITDSFAVTLTDGHWSNFDAGVVRSWVKAQNTIGLKITDTNVEARDPTVAHLEWVGAANKRAKREHNYHTYRFGASIDVDLVEVGAPVS